MCSSLRILGVIEMQKTAYDQGYEDTMCRLWLTKTANPLVAGALAAGRVALPWIGRGLLAGGRGLLSLGRGLFGRGAAGAAETAAKSTLGQKAVSGLNMAGNAGMAKSLFERPRAPRTTNPHTGEDFIPYNPPE
jgi:hypothetical protein